MSTDGARKKILIVDDTPDVLTVVGRRLQSWGYEALLAGSGEEGLRLAEEQLPDLILLDIMMPRMKGREVCARLKASERTKGIPVIFLTALGLADHVKAGMDLGAEDYIVKPFEPAQLKERITICLLRREQTAKPDLSAERR
jgi:two-component system phosphate regulon response regulator PhoB